MTQLFRKVLNLSLLFVLFTCKVYSQSLNDSLLIHYKFDGDSIDYSGNGYDPTLFRASYAEDASGNPNSALYFNGVDDLIILPDIQELKPDFPITVSFWIKMDNLSPESNVFFTNDFYRFSHSGVWLNLSSTQQMAVGIGDGSGFGLYTRRTKITDITFQSDVWYLVSAVLWSIDDMRIFINGIEEFGSMEGSANYIAYVGNGGNIGRKDANYQLDPYFFKGYFDDFRYWNRGLSDDEIFSLYSLTSINSEPLLTNQVSIYPNPASDYIYINIDKVDKLWVEIFDILGKKQMMVSNMDKINIRNLNKGIYNITITSSEKDGVVIRNAYTFIKK